MIMENKTPTAEQDLDAAHARIAQLTRLLQEAWARIEYLEGFTDTDDRVTFYERRFYPFSNFSSFQVAWHGRVWPTSEHAYHAQKFIDLAHYEAVRTCSSAHTAMIYARERKPLWRSDWQGVQRRVMKDICRAKLRQHEYIQKKLVESGDRALVEASPVDSYWGWGPDRNGQNELGKIWMELRDEWRAEHPEQWSAQ